MRARPRSARARGQPSTGVVATAGKPSKWRGPCRAARVYLGFLECPVYGSALCSWSPMPQLKRRRRITAGDSSTKTDKGGGGTPRDATWGGVHGVTEGDLEAARALIAGRTRAVVAVHKHRMPEVVEVARCPGASSPAASGWAEAAVARTSECC